MSSHVFDSSARDSAPTRWRVRASAFRDPVVDAQKVAVLLGIAPSMAARITMSTPSVVAHSTTRQDAESIADALRRLGAKVWLEDARSPIPSSIPPPPPARAASSAGPRLESPRRPRERSFWVQIPVAFVAPMLGRGSVLVLATGAAGALALCTAFMSVYLFPLRFALVVVLGLLAVGLLTTTFERLALAASLRDEGERLPCKSGPLPSLGELCWRGLMLSLLSAFLSSASYGAHAIGAEPLVVLIVSAAAYAYWPMALTMVSATGSWLAAFDAVRIFRVMAAAPLEYAAVLVSGGLGIGGVGLGMLACVGIGSGESGAALGASALVAVFAGFAGIAYLHGVLGYLMGSLARSKRDQLAFLAD